ncbi:MAG: D-alanine--D-alanine ligase [Phycisphaerales bacterium]|nr:D-alanine--D-alanine ligase [Planctomycetota bacterium]MCH8508443.1 D-alanine--D-alanine ligase [Phycisphaerales bacterium]
MSDTARVLVLGGGPDAEREISLKSSDAVHRAALEAGLDAEMFVIDRPTPEQVASWTGRVVLPILHGRFGEGGPLQRMMEQAGLCFVGCRSEAARLAMDKMATKLAGARVGVPTSPGAIVDPDDAVSPVGLPAVVKPVADGSSVGLHICRDQPAWEAAVAAVRDDQRAHPHRAYMAEPFIVGRELTVPVLGTDSGDLEALPIVEIAAAGGVYDYKAKYTRNDTRYTVLPELPEDMTEAIRGHAVRLARAIGVRHLARVDFLLPEGREPVMLEINTMPGFTPSSLLPMAARAKGMEMPALVAHLVRLATGG